MASRLPINLTYTTSLNQDGTVTVAATVQDANSIVLRSDQTTLVAGYTGLQKVAEFLRSVLKTAVEDSLSLSDLPPSGSINYDMPSTIGATVPLDILL